MRKNNMEEEAQAQVDVWKYAHGYSEMRAVRGVVDLGLPDVLERHGRPMTLAELSSAVGCPEASLYRIMRLMTHRGIFRKQITSAVCYAQTPLSRLLSREYMGSYVLVEAGSTLGFTAADLKSGLGASLDPASTEDKLWIRMEEEEAPRKRLLDMFASHGKMATSAVITNSPETFRGIATLVDVGGNKGTALGMLVKAFPWIRGINFDVPTVVSVAPPHHGVEHVGGNMFQDTIPKADAVMLMWILHDWGDDVCIEILKKCKEAIPADGGKVIIVETVIDEEERDEYSGARLALDIMLMAATANGKERTAEEWAKLIHAAGFSSHTIKHMKAIDSVIEAYP